MNKKDLMYRRTEAGAAIAASEDPEIPAEYQRILRFLEVESHAMMVRKFLRGQPEEVVTQWLAELEDLELIESQPATPEQDPEYTDRIQVAQIAAAYKKEQS